MFGSDLRNDTILCLEQANGYQRVGEPSAVVHLTLKLDEFAQLVTCRDEEDEMGIGTDATCLNEIPTMSTHQP